MFCVAIGFACGPLRLLEYFISLGLDLVVFSSCNYFLFGIFLYLFLRNIINSKVLPQILIIGCKFHLLVIATIPERDRKKREGEVEEDNITFSI